jgi:hypothetical protein
MRKSLWTISVLLLFAATPTFLRADITYTVNQTVGAGGVTGTITTDGTIGTLGATDIIGWNLLLNSGSSTITLTGPPSANSNVSNFGAELLTASATQLFYNFGGSVGAFFFVGPGNASTWCLGTGNPCVSPAGEGVRIDPVLVFSQNTGDPAIATVTSTPEPGTSLLMLIGVGLVLAVMRKRIAQGLPQAI